MPAIYCSYSACVLCVYWVFINKCTEGPHLWQTQTNLKSSDCKVVFILYVMAAGLTSSHLEEHAIPEINTLQTTLTLDNIYITTNGDAYGDMMNNTVWYCCDYFHPPSQHPLSSLLMDLITSCGRVILFSVRCTIFKRKPGQWRNNVIMDTQQLSVLFTFSWVTVRLSVAPGGPGGPGRP